jgi:glycosyltransferase involved in cell wall biosynthesis
LAIKITISVISDLVTDQRVHKVATTLQQNGYTVTVIGAKRAMSKDLQKQIYATQRISLLFEKGFLMYAEWNIRLFFLLLFKKMDVLVANDLDTLLPNYIHSKLRKIKLVYDSHEYFTEQEELINRKRVQRVWLKIEQYIFPKLKNVYTVNDSIAHIYTAKYNVPVKVIKNLPLVNTIIEKPNNAIEQLVLSKEHNKILLTQGTGFNANRGIEELIEAMVILHPNYVLFIVGTGLVINELKLKVNNLQLLDKVFFIPTVTPTQLKWITQRAYLGFTLDKATCLNYEYSLPNKLFDFIQANVPIVSSNRVEVANVINTNKIGAVINDVTPQNIATVINEIDESSYSAYKINVKKIEANYTWQNQTQQLLEFYRHLQ